MKRPRIYESEEDEYVPEYKLVPKPRSQGQSVSPPNILVGSKSRLKVLVLDKFPSIYFNLLRVILALQFVSNTAQF